MKAMGTRYCLGRGVIGESNFVDISAEEFARAKEAKDNLFTLLGVEEKLDMLLENYAEYEQTLLNLALGHAIGHPLDWDSFRDGLFLMNRRLSNVLAVCRQYVDQVQHDFSSIYGSDGEMKDRLKGIFGDQYDRLLGYRVMDALRNYTQHRAFPVTMLSYPTAWDKERLHLHFRTKAAIRLEDVRDDKFSSRVREELRALGGDSFDLTRFLREYVEGFCHAHTKIRELTQSEAERWGETIRATLQRYGQQEGIPKHIVAYSLTDEIVIEEVSIFMNGIDRLRQLRTRRLPLGLSCWHV